MADLSSSNVTITVQEKSIAGKKKRNRVRISFGDGALTYPALGVPLPTFPSYAMVRQLDYLLLSDSNDGSGLLWKYDKDNNKLRAYQSPAVTPSGSTDSVSGGTPSGTNSAPTITLVDDGGTPTADIGHFGGALSENDVTPTSGITGVQAPMFAGDALAGHSHTLSGSPSSAAALAELGNVAVAAQVMYAEAIGW